MKKILTGILSCAALAFAGFAQAQMINGNTMPFWNVTGPLTVGGTTTLSGSMNLIGNATMQGVNNQIKGVVTNSDAPTGYIGEVLTSTVAVGSAISHTNATSVNITSVTLTAGDWDVGAMCDYNLTGATVTQVQCGLSATTTVLPTQAGGSGIGSDPLRIDAGALTTYTGVTNYGIIPVRIKLAASTPIYLVSNVTFSAGTVGGFGTIYARRRR